LDAPPHDPSKETTIGLLGFQDMPNKALGCLPQASRANNSSFFFFHLIHKKILVPLTIHNINEKTITKKDQKAR